MLDRTGSTETPFQYIGGYGYYTGEQGLINAWHRWYLPSAGKWLSRDPLWDGSNPYSYVGEMPTVFVDPRGLQAQTPYYAPSTPDARGRWPKWLGVGAIYDAWWDYYVKEPLQMQQNPCFDVINCLADCMSPAQIKKYADLPAMLAPGTTRYHFIGKDDAKKYFGSRVIRHPKSSRWTTWARIEQVRDVHEGPRWNYWGPLADRLKDMPLGARVAVAGMTTMLDILFAIDAGWTIGMWTRCLARCL